jgi:hypothetical protein
MRWLKVSLLVVLFSVGLTAQSQNITNRFFTAYDVENLTVAASSIGFTASKVTPTGVPYRANLITFKVDCATTACDISFTIDGTTPTASVGMLASKGDVVQLYNYANIRNFRAIRVGADNATLRTIFNY